MLETFVKRAAARRRARGGLLGRRRAPSGAARSPSTTPRCSSAGSPAARSAIFEATRFATGRKNAIRIEINGSRGQPGLRLRGHERPAVLRRRRARPRPPGFRRILVTEPEHPYVAAWWPPGHGLGYEHGFTHQVVDLVTAIAEGSDPAPSFADGLQVQRVLAAVERSSAHDSQPGTDRSARRRRPMTRPDHPVHRPVGRPAVRGGVPAGLRVGLRRPGDRLLGRPPRRRARRRRRRLRRRSRLEILEQARPAGVRDLQPPQGPGRLRRPDRRAAPRHPARRGLGRRRPRGRAAAGGRGDEA